MNKYENKLDELLRESRAVLVRNRRHKIFRLEDGQNFVVSKTPSTQGSSKQSLATLTRLLRDRALDTQASPPAAADISEIRSKRFVAANNPPRERGGVLFSNLNRGDKADHFPPNTATRLDNIVELMMAADESDEFWALDASGRINALRRIAQNFAKVEVLAVQFCRASPEEINRHYGIGQERNDPTFNTMESILQRESPLSLRIIDEWSGFNGLPSMLVHDPLFGTVLVEASAWSILENTNYLFFWCGKPYGSSYGISSQVWNSSDPTRQPNDGEFPDHLIYSVFITRAMMKRKAYKLLTSSSWEDLKSTRAAIRQILQIANDQRSKRKSL